LKKQYFIEKVGWFNLTPGVTRALT